MKDEEYLFYTDAADKKRIARSASKRNRTGKGAVRLPSDYLTKKELESMNGEVKTCNLSKPMHWDGFKKLGKHLQTEYIEVLDEKFAPTNAMLGNMFGVTPKSISLMRQNLGIKALREKGKPLNGKPPNKSGWNDWLKENGWQEPKQETEDVEEKGAEATSLFSVRCADFEVMATPDDLALLLKAVAGNKSRVFKISFSEEG